MVATSSPTRPIAQEGYGRFTGGDAIRQHQDGGDLQADQEFTSDDDRSLLEQSA
jgi:hypothetical protein